MTTRLLIARHGNTFEKGETPRRVGARTDLPLTADGLAQGTFLGNYLAAQGLQPSVIYSSELTRTHQTAMQVAAVFGGDVAVIKDSAFNEIDYGADENLPEDAVAARVGADALKNWDDNAVVPDGWNVDPQAIIQSWHDFAARAATQFAGQNVMVVTSNGIARFAPYLTGDFYGFKEKHGLKMATGALSIFEKADNFWRAAAWNLKP